MVILVIFVVDFVFGNIMLMFGKSINCLLSLSDSVLIVVFRL